MSDRSPHSVRLDDETWSQFTEWVEDVEGQKHGEIGRHVENALNEYMNEDRQARLEKNQQEIQEELHDLRALLDERAGTHTHKTNAGCNESDLVTEIHQQIVHNHDEAVKDEAVEQAIIDVAELPVGDPRTIRRYKQNLRKRGLLYEHPGDPPIWTEDREIWVNWANSTAASVGDLESAVDPYPAQVYENGQGPHIEFAEADE